MFVPPRYKVRSYVLRAQPLKVVRSQRDRDGADDAGEARRTKRPTSEKAVREKSQGVLKLGAKRQITGWCGTKTDNLTVSENTTKSDLIDRIAEKLEEPKGSYSLEIKDRGGQLRTAYAVHEGWSYKIHRLSPPGTQEAPDQALRHRGNETRQLLNRSSVTAMREEELSRGDAVRRNAAVTLRCTIDGERRQSVEARGDTAAPDLTHRIMEKYGMTGWGHLMVLRGGKPGSFSIDVNAEYRVSARARPGTVTQVFRENPDAAGQNTARTSGTSEAVLEGEERGRVG
jgi:hypothetical protein